MGEHAKSLRLQQRQDICNSNTSFLFALHAVFALQPQWAEEYLVYGWSGERRTEAHLLSPHSGWEATGVRCLGAAEYCGHGMDTP